MIWYIGIWVFFGTLCTSLGVSLWFLIGAMFDSTSSVLEVLSKLFINASLITMTMMSIPTVKDNIMPGTIRKACNKYLTEKVIKSYEDIYYETYQGKCIKYFSGQIYLEGEWKELVE